MKDSDATIDHKSQFLSLGYRSIIPFYILLDPNISRNEIALYALIEQMESNKQDVFYTNKRIAAILDVSVRAVQQMSEHLQKKGHIRREFRVVSIGKRKKEMHCWNTVKQSMITDYTDDEAELHPMVSDYTGGEAQLHGGGEAQLHGGGEAQLHPCKTLKEKTLKESVCGKNSSQNTHTHTDSSPLTTLISNPECQELFSFRFSEHEVSIDELADACIKYYSPTIVSVLTFKTWIRLEKIENHPKKGKTKTKLSQTFTTDELEKAGQYRQAKKDGFIETWYPNIEKREQARLIYERVYLHMA